MRPSEKGGIFLKGGDYTPIYTKINSNIPDLNNKFKIYIQSLTEKIKLNANIDYNFMF